MQVIHSLTNVYQMHWYSSLTSLRRYYRRCGITQSSRNPAHAVAVSVAKQGNINLTPSLKELTMKTKVNPQVLPVYALYLKYGTNPATEQCFSDCWESFKTLIATIKADTKAKQVVMPCQN
jgi:hypothetical protein